MRFHLVDRILEVEPGQRLRAVKHLTLGEEYLADHFPTFPVMPGVLMLQMLVEAGAWLLRATDDFAYSVTVLREAKGIKYGTFMQPGRSLEAVVELVRRDGATAVLKGKGTTGGQTTVSGQVTLVSYNLADRRPEWAGRDGRLAQHWRDQYALLRGELIAATKLDPAGSAARGQGLT
jgi:3-hydroxyacyl-[acyl-carrier-protein] dehydratase